MKRLIGLLMGLMLAACANSAPFVSGQTLTAAQLNSAFANAAITSGSIDGVSVTNSIIDNTVIGATTPNNGTFVTLTATSSVSAPLFVGNLTGNASGSAASATDIAGKTQWGLLYQSAVGVTASTAAGTSGYLLTGNGASAPTFQALNLSSPPAIGATTPSTGKFSTVESVGNIYLNGNLLYSATAPTIASGFGTTPSIFYANGTASFLVDVGSGGTAFSGIITMPSGASNGWNCTVRPYIFHVGNTTTYQSSGSVSSISFTNVNSTTWSATAWQATEQFWVSCVGY